MASLRLSLLPLVLLSLSLSCKSYTHNSSSSLLSLSFSRPMSASPVSPPPAAHATPVAPNAPSRRHHHQHHMRTTEHDWRAEQMRLNAAFELTRCLVKIYQAGALVREDTIQVDTRCSAHWTTQVRDHINDTRPALHSGQCHGQVVFTPNTTNPNHADYQCQCGLAKAHAELQQ